MSSSCSSVEAHHGRRVATLCASRRGPTAVRRYQPDGTIHSICIRCLAVIARAYTDGELTPCEAAHICDPRDLGHTNPSSA